MEEKRASTSIPVIIEPETNEGSSSEDDNEVLPPPQVTAKRPSIRWVPPLGRMSVDVSSRLGAVLDEVDESKSPSVLKQEFTFPVPNPPVVEEDSDSDDYEPPPNPVVRKTSVGWATDSTTGSVKAESQGPKRSSISFRTDRRGSIANQLDTSQSKLENSRRLSVTKPDEMGSSAKIVKSQSHSLLPPKELSKSVGISSDGMAAQRSSELQVPVCNVPATSTEIIGTRSSELQVPIFTVSSTSADGMARKSSELQVPIPVMPATSSEGVSRRPSELHPPILKSAMTSSDGVSKRSSVMQPLGGLKAPDTEGKMKSKQSLHSTTEPKRSKTKLIGSMNELSKSVDSGNMGRVSWYAPFTHWIYELTNYLQEKYYEYVSYRAECILELFLLIPFGLLGLILYYMDSAILPNAIVEVLLKVSLVVAGQIAEYSASIINKRHSQMKLMAKIAANRATARDVFNTLRGKNINRVLKYSAILFNAYMIAAELVMEPRYVLTEVGTGLTIHLPQNLSSVVATSLPHTFAVSTGSGLACQSCSGLRVHDHLYVPVSSYLTGIQTRSNLDQMFLGNDQEVMAITTHCYDIIAPVSNVSFSDIDFNVINLIRGNQFTQSDVEVYARSPSGLKGKRCRILIADRRGYVFFKYGIFKGQYPQMTSVTSIEADPRLPCAKGGPLCLNATKRQNVSFTLLSAAFSSNRFLIDRTKFAPDPTKDLDFRIEMQNFVSLLLVNSASMYMTVRQTRPLFTDTISLRLIAVPVLQITTISLCIFCVALACFQIGIDLIQLGKASNELLRRLQRVVRPGKENLESLAQFSKETIDSAAVLEEWDYALIKFGEDKKTASAALGILRFGTRRDIIRFNDDRAYY